MKKVLLTLACVFGMSITASALTSSAVLLQHDGKITTYAAEDIDQAMAAAADGDEVFLNEGKYPGFTISKAIKIKGAGQTTVIDGDIVIENKDKELGDIFIGFLYLAGSIESKSKIGKLDLMQLKATKGGWPSNGTINEIFIDRCDFVSSGYVINLANYYTETVTVDDVTTTTIYPRIKKFTAMNSRIYVKQGTGYTVYPPYTFVNCYVRDLDYGSLLGVTIINSIVVIDSRATIGHSELINCVKKGAFADTNKLTGCYNDGDITSDWTINQMEENGYFGNDGTVVGPLGGARNTPFTLVPVVPRVTESTLKVDPEKKELNVSVTVSPK